MSEYERRFKTRYGNYLDDGNGRKEERGKVEEGESSSLSGLTINYNY